MTTSSQTHVAETAEFRSDPTHMALHTPRTRFAPKSARCYLCGKKHDVMKNPLDACHDCDKFGEGYHMATLFYEDGASIVRCCVCLKSSCGAVYDANPDTHHVRCVLVSTRTAREYAWFVSWPRGTRRRDETTGVRECSVEVGRMLSSILRVSEQKAHSKFVSAHGTEKWKFVERCSREVKVLLEHKMHFEYLSCKISLYTAHRAGNHVILHGLGRLGDLEVRRLRLKRWATQLLGKESVDQLKRHHRNAVYESHVGTRVSKVFVSYGFQIKSARRTLNRYELNVSPLQPSDIPLQVRLDIAEIVSAGRKVMSDKLAIQMPGFFALDVVSVDGDGTGMHLDHGHASGDGYANGVFLENLDVHGAKKLVLDNVCSSTKPKDVGGIVVRTGDCWYMNDRAGSAAPHAIYCHRSCKYLYIVLRGVTEKYVREYKAERILP